MTKGVRNFFILAPNLTIYNKLIEDFGNPAYPKYVFNGIGEFVHNKPVIITGDNYTQQSNLFNEQEIRINIFNVSKFNSENRGTNRAGIKQPPRIKRLSEYLGQSYWDYLSGLKDLVILMDEAHRYHADASRKAINELKPILGIELTATPIDETGEKFKNVVYEYSLAVALKEGLYVKAPAVATRKNFDKTGLSPEEIEQIKLEDAVNVHEDTKTELEVFHKNTGSKLVKPLILVAAKDTSHAKAIYEFINSKQFFDGRYMDKVLQIDSTNADDDEVNSLFISLESADNPVEIVIHVFKLKEGWDVSNLYTICPLNAANSQVLIEQTLGRGLRLPFDGMRTGIEKLDKLTLIAHDNYQRILEEAKNPDSVLNKIKLIEVEIEPGAAATTIVKSITSFEDGLNLQKAAAEKLPEGEGKQKKLNQLDAQRLIIHYLPVVNNLPSVKKIADTTNAEAQKAVLKAIETELFSGQPSLFAGQILEEAEAIYKTVVKEFEKKTIEIPRMVLLRPDATPVFHDFDLNTTGFDYEKLNEEIIRMGLTDHSVDTIKVKQGIKQQSAIEMIMVELNNFPEINYETAELQFKLTKQALTTIESSLPDKNDLYNVARQWKRTIAERIYNQMMQHFELLQGDYEKPGVLPFVRIEEPSFSMLSNNGYRHYTDESMAASQVKSYVFTGFKKSCHKDYKFDVRTEQTFSFILENDDDVLKWLKPASKQFSIYWNHKSSQYEPDFIVETVNCIYMIETKAANEVDDADVQEKSAAAIKYCNYATEFTAENGGKPWKYAIIPHDQVERNKSFKGVVVQNIKK
jgi:type III restriction enzyme